MPIKSSLNRLRDRLFKRVHSNYLIYNICWEDPRPDRDMLNLDADSRVVMITSAGCNALDYLLDNPAHIHCIDMNPRQNSLLELKLALFKHANFQDLWRFFGKGHYAGAQQVYQDKLQPNLPDFARQFWDQKLFYFTKAEKKSFYFYGTSGAFAWWFHKYTRTKRRLRALIMRLVDAESLEEQKEIYDQIEPMLLNRFLIWMVNRQFTLSLLGVPRAQRQLIRNEYPGKLAGYIKDNFRRVFTELPISENYFWRVYITGSFTPSCAPNYLLEDNFETLRSRVDRISTHTTTISDFLRNNPAPYSQYILLDHQDWLASNAPELLEEEWELILQNSRPGTRILLRSAAVRVDFLPEFVNERVAWDLDEAARQHPRDRVGTYGSVYIGTVK